MTYLLRAATIAAGLWVVGAFAGALHPLGDSLAMFVVPSAIGGVLTVLLNWRWRMGRVFLLLFLPVLALRVFLGLEQAPLNQVDYVVYQKNMLFRDMDRRDLIADIRQSGADFVTLQEVSQANLPMVEALQVDYPHQHICPGRAIGGTAILSKHPLEPIPCADVFGLTEAWSSTPNGRVRIASVHLHWPYPFRQADHVESLLAAMAPADEAPRIVAGDFNMVPWGHSVRRIAQATETRWLSPIVRTFSLRGYPFFIDHVMAGPEAALRIDVRPRLGSDHYGVLARIAL